MEGVKARAVIEDPIAPRVFAVSRDGSALELLRPADVLEWEAHIGRAGLLSHKTLQQVGARVRARVVYPIRLPHVELTGLMACLPCLGRGTGRATMSPAT
jgi:hypothetical protein